MWCWFLGLIFLPCIAFSQILPDERKVNWAMAGLRDSFPVFYDTINIVENGGVGDGITTNDHIIKEVIAELNGMPGIIYFPAGDYLFKKSIQINSNIILKGESPGNTNLIFDLEGKPLNLIEIRGSYSSTISYLAWPGKKDSTFIDLENANLFQKGDFIKLFQDNDANVFSPWAGKCIGQIIKIKSVSKNRIYLESPLRKNFPLTFQPCIIKMEPKRNIGIECLKIERLDETINQSSNIKFETAVNCYIQNIESYRVNFAHVEISNCSNISVNDSYFHDAFSFGEGGKAYGILIESTSGECLIENNIFNHLRHSMVLQTGANGNVFGYNYSINSKWQQSLLPENASGDLVLHGNYPFFNLFEGNIAQNIVIDDSHGINGPGNTFFRNRALLYGVFMNDNPPSPRQNFIGNEIVNKNPHMGMFVLNGGDHFIHGNVIKNPNENFGIDYLPDRSYYLKKFPDFFRQGEKWPGIGPPYKFNEAVIPAMNNFIYGIKPDCNNSGIYKGEPENLFYPNPTNGELFNNFHSSGKNLVEVYNHTGNRVYSGNLNSNEILDLSNFPNGIYLITGKHQTQKILKVGL